MSENKHNTIPCITDLQEHAGAGVRDRGDDCRIPQHSSDPLVVYEMFDSYSPAGIASLSDLSSFSGGAFADRYSAALCRRLGRDGAGASFEKILADCTQMVANLWHLPGLGGKDRCGMAAFCGSQAAMIAGVAAWMRWRVSAARADVPNFVVTPNHNPVWKTFASLLGMDMRVCGLPLADGRTDLSGLCDRNTIMVVGTVGSVCTSLDDDVPGLSEALDVLEVRTGMAIPLHVDAMAAGFVAPFLRPHSKWDFRVSRVSSISASADYGGLTYPSLGWVLWRNPDDTLSSLSGDPEPSDTMSNKGDSAEDYFRFSPAAEPVVVQFFNFLRLGYDGNRALNYRRVRIAGRIRTELSGMPGVSLLGNDTHSPFMVFRVAGQRRSAESVRKALRLRGWNVALTPLPDALGGGHAIRVVIRHDTAEQVADLFTADLKTIMSEYQQLESAR